MIRNNDGYTPETEALLFVADRAVHTIEIRKWIADGNTVICDRYYASTLAYQTASFGEKALDMDWLECLNEKVTKEPDMTFLLDLDPVQGMSRVGNRGDEISRFERLEYQRKVRENYLLIAKKKNFIIVDASKDRCEVFSSVLKRIRERLED